MASRKDKRETKSLLDRGMKEDKINLNTYICVNGFLVIVFVTLFIVLLVHGINNPLNVDVGMFIYNNDASANTVLGGPVPIPLFNNIIWRSSGKMNVRLLNPFFNLITAGEHLLYVYHGYFQPEIVYKMIETRHNPYRWIFYTLSVCPILYIGLTRISGNVDVTNMMNGGMCFVAMMFTGDLFERTGDGGYILFGSFFGLMPFLGDLIRIGLTSFTPSWVKAIISVTYILFTCFMFVTITDWYSRRTKYDQISYTKIIYAYTFLSLTTKTVLGCVVSYAGG